LPQPVMGEPTIPATLPTGASVQTNVPIWYMGDVAQTSMRDFLKHAQSTNSTGKK